MTAQKEKLEAAMLAGDFYADKEKSIKVQKEYSDVVAKLAEQEELWLEAQVA